MDIQTIASIISSVFSLAILILIIRIIKQQNEIYKSRIEAAKEKNEITQERLKLAEEENKRFQSLNEKLTKIGASIGIDEFKEDLKSHQIGNIGNNFSGEIKQAGRDINETLNQLVNQIDKRIIQLKEWLITQRIRFAKMMMLFNMNTR